jgi:heat shock protein HtpX
LLLVFNFFIYFFSGSLAIKSTRAQLIQDGEYEEVTQIISTSYKKKKCQCQNLYVINSDQPNAFATGRNPKNAKVAVTTGILKLLNRDELEGVLAHELSHIKNRDILVSSIAAMLAAASHLCPEWFFGVVVTETEILTLQL